MRCSYKVFLIRKAGNSWAGLQPFHCQHLLQLQVHQRLVWRSLICYVFTSHPHNDSREGIYIFFFFYLFITDTFDDSNWIYICKAFSLLTNTSGSLFSFNPHMEGTLSLNQNMHFVLSFPSKTIFWYNRAFCKFVFQNAN